MLLMDLFMPRKRDTANLSATDQAEQSYHHNYYLEHRERIRANQKRYRERLKQKKLESAGASSNKPKKRKQKPKNDQLINQSPPSSSLELDNQSELPRTKRQRIPSIRFLESLQTDTVEISQESDNTNLKNSVGTQTENTTTPEKTKDKSTQTANPANTLRTDYLKNQATLPTFIGKGNTQEQAKQPLLVIIENETNNDSALTADEAIMNNISDPKSSLLKDQIRLNIRELSIYWPAIKRTTSWINDSHALTKQQMTQVRSIHHQREQLPVARLYFPDLLLDSKIDFKNFKSFITYANTNTQIKDEDLEVRFNLALAQYINSRWQESLFSFIELLKDCRQRYTNEELFKKNIYLVASYVALITEIIVADMRADLGKTTFLTHKVISNKGEDKYVVGTRLSKFPNFFDNIYNEDFPRLKKESVEDYAKRVAIEKKSGKRTELAVIANILMDVLSDKQLDAIKQGILKTISTVNTISNGLKPKKYPIKKSFTK